MARRSPAQRPTRNRFAIPALAGVGVGVVVLALAAFALLGRDTGGGNESPAAVPSQVPAAAAAVATGVAAPDDALRVFPASSAFVVGPRQRFSVGLVDGRAPLDGGQVDLHFYKLDGQGPGTLRESLPAPFQPYGLEETHDDGHGPNSEVTGVYVARPSFGEAGEWGVVASATGPDGAFRRGQASFTVAADVPVPAAGEAPPAIKTLTADTPEEAAKICTADPVDDMHALSVDEALANGRPTVVLFATPLLCSTRTCGPSWETLVELKKRYGAGANFVHVEVYPERDVEKPAAALAEWNLPSEPWLFLFDAEGKVVDRYEGGIGLTELDPPVRTLVDQAADAGRAPRG